MLTVPEVVDWHKVKTAEDVTYLMISIGVKNGWDEPEPAFGSCIQASMAFSGFCDRHNVPCRIVSFSGRPQVALDAINTYDKFGMIDRRLKVGHVVCKCGDAYIDWTARQFYPKATFPKIWTLQELHEAGWQEGRPT